MIMDFEAAMARIHAITGTRTQVELAKVLGIRQSSISDAKRRQSIPDSWLQTIIWKFDGNPRWVLGESERPYICEDTSRDLANPAPMVTAPPIEPEPTLSDILAVAREKAGPGYEFVMVPCGTGISMDLPQSVNALDDIESAQPPVLALPDREAA
jgi:hypothetical protein